MSFILDALKKADADRERERGAVPTLHAQAATLGSTARPQGAPVQWLVWVVLVLAVLLIGAAIWIAFVRPPSAPPAGMASAPAAGSVAAPAPAPALSSAPSIAPPQFVVTVQPKPPVVQPARPELAAKPATPAVSPPAPPAATAANPPAPSAPTPPAPGAPTPPPKTVEFQRNAVPLAPPPAPILDTPKPAAERILSQSELPPDVARAVPAISFGGSMYSANPTNRMLIINGQPLHEGDEAAPGLVVDQIRAKSAVFRFRGYRFEMGF